MTAAAALECLPHLTTEQAENWIAAALAEARALRQYDAQLFPPVTDSASVRIAHRLHEAWRRWSEDAEVLARRIEPLLTSKQHVSGAGDLEYEIARACSTLNLTPQSMQARRDQMARGEVKSAEEVRRELFPARGR